MLKIFPLSDAILRMVPVADPTKKDQFRAVQVRDLAERILQGSPEVLDNLQTEWNEFLMEEKPVGVVDIPNFWKAASLEFPNLATLMQALISIPHSNAQSERVFSMLKKIYTDQRADLCKDSLNSLLAVKMNVDTCCFDTNIDRSLCKKLKKAAYDYNLQHGSYAIKAAEADGANFNNDGAKNVAGAEGGDNQPAEANDADANDADANGDSVEVIEID